MDTSFEILQPEIDIKEDKAKHKLSTKPDLIPEGIAKERRSRGGPQKEAGKMKLDISEGAKGEGISYSSKILSEATSTAGSIESGLVMKNKVPASDSSDKSVESVEAKRPTSGNLVPNVAKASRGTPQFQYPSTALLAAKEKGKKSPSPDETKYPEDKHVHWKKGENIHKAEMQKMLTQSQRSSEIRVKYDVAAPLADMDEMSEVDSQWLMKDDGQTKRKNSLDESDVNLAKSIKSSFEKSTRITSQFTTTSVVKHSKITPATSSQFKEPDITSYIVQHSEKHELVNTNTTSDPDNKENIAARDDNSQDLPKIDVTKDGVKECEKKEKLGGSLFGITGEKRVTDDDKMKLKESTKGKSEASKKKIVLPVIRPTDPRRWAIALTDYSYVPQPVSQMVSQNMEPVKSKDLHVGERPKDHRRWGIAPRGQGNAPPPHEQYSQEFECKESDAECTEPPSDSKKENIPLSATVATTMPHQSPLMSTTTTKPVLPRLLQPTRKTSPGIIYYDDRASVLSSESLKSDSPEQQLAAGTASRRTDTSQGAVGVSRFRKLDSTDNVDTDKDKRKVDPDPGPPYILYRRVQDGTQSVVVSPPTSENMGEGEPIRSYSRHDPDTDNIISEDIPRYVRKDQKQDMLASRMGSKSYPLLSTMPAHHSSHDSLHSLAEVRADHGRKGFMVYMVTKQPSPGPSDEATDDTVDESDPTYKSPDATDDIEYYGPRRIHTSSSGPSTTRIDIKHYHSMPDMDTFGQPRQNVGRPLSARSAPEEDEDLMPQVTYKPAYGPYSELIENTGHTFGVFGKKLTPSQASKSPTSPRSPRSPRRKRPSGPPPPVPPRKTPVKQPEHVAGIQSSKFPQEIAAMEGHMFGFFGQQMPQDTRGTEPHTTYDDSLSSSSIKDIMSKLDLFEERGRKMDKTGAGPAVLGQERVEVSLLRHKVISQPGEPFGERQFVVGKASPMGARLTRPASFPMSAQGEQIIISPENQALHDDQQQESQPQMQQQYQQQPKHSDPPRSRKDKYIERQQQQRLQPRAQEDLQEEERVFSVREIIQKMNTGQAPEVTKKKDANKYEKCPYTAVAKRYIADSKKVEKPMRYDDRREPEEDMVQYYEPVHDVAQIEKIDKFRELQMIYQNTSSIQDYDEEPLHQPALHETSIDDDIKFMDDTDVTSVDSSDTDSGGDGAHEWEWDVSLWQQESLKRLKPLGQKRLAQIHAIMDKKLGGKTSGERESPEEDLSSYCLSKEKQKILSRERQKALIQVPIHTRSEPIRKPRPTEPERMPDAVIMSNQRAKEDVEVKKNESDDDTTPVESEESSDTESVDTQMDTSEIPFDDEGKAVSDKGIEDTDKHLEEKETEAVVVETIAHRTDLVESYEVEEEETGEQMTDEEQQKKILKEREEREELLRNEEKIRELEEKLARLEAPVREAVRKLLQVSGEINK